MAKFSLVFLCLFFFGCSTSNFQYSFYETRADGFKERAISALLEYEKICQQDAGKLWGVSLCVNLVIIDHKTKIAVSNRVDPKAKFVSIGQGLFQGEYYGLELYANTSILWEGQRWSTVIAPLDNNRQAVLELLIHEAWHSIQHKLNFPMHSMMLEHLETFEGRLLIRFEWESLLLALRKPSQLKLYLQHALIARSLRYTHNKNFKKQERMLDLNEGLASYSGMALTYPTHDERLVRLESLVKGLREDFSLTRSSSYIAGPLYGALFDRLELKWRDKLKSEGGFDQIINAYLEESQLLNDRSLIVDLPTYQKIFYEEKRREDNKNRSIQDWLKKYEAPNHLKLEVMRGSYISFDPNQIFPLGNNRFIYKVISTRGHWGELVVENGALIQLFDDKMVISLSAVRDNDSKVVTGAGWALKLNPGWKVRQNESSLNWSLFK